MRRANFIAVQSKLLQTRIAELQARERALQTRQNALVPLCTLPTEILVHIMDLLLQSAYMNEEGEGRRRERCHMGWVAVMGTCTRMRSLILHTPHLWVDINLNRRKEWTKLSLRRAAHSLIHVSLSDMAAYPWKDCECDDGISPRLSKEEESRLRRSLKATLPRASVINLDFRFSLPLFLVACQLLRAPTLPHLRSLTYATSSESHFFRHPAFAAENFVPLLQGATELNHLSVDGIEVLNTGICVPTLVHFEIQIAGPHNIAHLVSFLSDCPLLEHLKIDVMFVHAPFDSLSPIEPIELPHLRILDLKTDLSVFLCHLRALPTPRDTLRASVSSYHTNSTDHNAAVVHEELFARIWGMLENMQEIPLVAFKVAVLGRAVLTVTHQGARTHEIIFSCAGSLKDLQSVMRAMRSVRIAGAEEAYQSDLLDWAASNPLENFPSVENVVVDHVCAERIQTSLRAWLQARINADQRIRVLDLRGCAQQRPACVYGGEDEGGVRRMAQELSEAGMAETVLMGGKAWV
jgi:hypothetical protein